MTPLTNDSNIPSPHIGRGNDVISQPSGVKSAHFSGCSEPGFSKKHNIDIVLNNKVADIFFQFVFLGDPTDCA